MVRRHPETGDRRLDLLRWGLIPRFIKDPKPARKPINARSETAATSGMFRGALASRAVHRVSNNGAELLDRIDDPAAAPASDAPAGANPA